MFAYWFLFLAASAGVMTHRPNPNPNKTLGALIVMLLLVGGLVGFRYKVGADWITYDEIFWEIGFRRLDEILVRPETGYQLVNYFVNLAGLRVWAVNLVCGAIFASGLITFARRQADPWLTIVAACPYLITVVAMGYTRQGVAIGLLLFGLASFFKTQSPLRFAVWVVAAAMFHRTAVAAFPLVAFASPRNRLLNALIGIASGLALYDFFLDDTMQNYVHNYVDAGYSSSGAAARISISVLSAVILFASESRLQFPPIEHAVWRNFSIAALGLLAGLMLVPSSTAVDRLGLYVIPLQLAVMARVPVLFRDWRVGRLAVIGFEAIVLFSWLTFAVHARFWVPYRLYPL